MENLKVTTDLLRKEGTVSKPYTMISEFIDNSLSSWIGYGKNLEIEEKRNLKGCIIEIFFDFTDSKNRKLSITDNSFGMNENILRNAIQPSDRNRENKTSSLNRYGVGMKTAAFWSGERLEIITKNEGKTIETYIDLKELDAKNNGIVNFEIKSSNKKLTFMSKELGHLDLPHGSQFKIDYVDKNRYDMGKTDKFNVFKHVLGTKFKRYLEKGARIFIKLEHSKTSKFEEVVPTSPRPEIIQNWTKKKIRADKNVSADNAKEKIWNWFNKFSKTIDRKNIDREIALKIESSFTKGEPLIWEEKFYLGENFYLPIKLGVLENSSLKESGGIEQSYLNYMGFSVFESDRAIMCSPNDLNDAFGSKNYLGPLKAKYGGTAIDYRIFGEFDIDELLKFNKVKLSDNKFGFEWNSSSFKDKFDDCVIGWVKARREVIKNLTTFQHRHDDPEEAKKRVENSFLATNFFSDNVEVDEEQNAIEEQRQEKNVYNYKLFDGPDKKTYKKIRIIHKEENMRAKNFFKLTSRSINRLEIMINAYHPIWVPLLSKNVLSKKELMPTLHKMVVLLVLANEEFEGLADKIDSIANHEFKED